MTSPPPPAGNFNFDSPCSSPYVTAPSSPQRFGSSYFFSAPASPARVSASSDTTFGQYSGGGESPPAKEENTDFAFDFSGQLERISLSADELFDGGIIKPLKPPPQAQVRDTNSPHSNKEKLSEAFQQKLGGHTKEHTDDQCKRGRTSHSPNSSGRHKSTRSLSPLRVSDLLFEKENNPQNSKQFSSSSSPVSWYSKWNLKDLLFRSKSEGSASTNKDPLKKYGLLKRRESEEVKNSSFRSVGSSSSVGSSLRRKRINGSVSAHEMHYTVNRAVSEEMKKKTFLPYKQGLLGCLGFSPSVRLGSSILTR